MKNAKIPVICNKTDDANNIIGKYILINSHREDNADHRVELFKVISARYIYPDDWPNFNAAKLEINGTEYNHCIIPIKNGIELIKKGHTSVFTVGYCKHWIEQWYIVA